jgi:hypothetical protein
MTRNFPSLMILLTAIALVLFYAYAAHAAAFRSIDAATCIDCLRGINAWRH